MTQAQTRQQKPPNYSRINSTLKLFRPSIQSGLQSATTQPKASYSSVVKGTKDIGSSTAKTSSERPPGPFLEEQLPIVCCEDKGEESSNYTLKNSDGNSFSMSVEIEPNTEIKIPGDEASDSSVCSYKESILSTPERPPGPLLEERDGNISALPINTASISEQPHAPESSINLNHLSSLDTDVGMSETEVASINAHGEFDSLEDITVYEVVTEYQSAPTMLTANYPACIPSTSRRANN